MTLLHENPFASILDEIAKHGENVAPIPVSSAYELDDELGVRIWAIDVDVRILRRTSFDFVSTGETFELALRRAFNRLKTELPKC